MKPIMPCPKCDGAGEIPLSFELWQVLRLVRKRRGITAPDVAEALDPRGEFHPSAFNNRLEILRNMGLVKRRRSGKTWFYSITKSTK